MAGYIGPQPVPQATQHRESFTATSGQTSFATAGYTPQFLDVYLNGVHLLDGTDYTATNGSDVVLTTGAATDDILEVVSYTPFEVADQTFTGTTTVSQSASGAGGWNEALVLKGTYPLLALHETTTDKYSRIGNNGDGSIQFFVNGTSGSVGTNAAGIDPSGNVGIGIPSANSTLHIGTSAVSSVPAAGTGAVEGLMVSADLNTYGTLLGTTTDGNGYIQQQRTDTATHYDLLIQPNGGNLLVAKDSFSGDVTTAGHLFYGVGKTVHTSSIPQCLVLANTQTSGNADPIEFYYGGSIVGKVSTNASGTTYSTTSDRRLKDNIQPIADATDKLMAMNPVSHTWIADPEADSVVGFIAQEMQEIVPEAVSGEPDGEEMMSMDYGRITPVLVAALQEATNEIKALKERVAELEGK